jgi:hypothetical protein
MRIRSTLAVALSAGVLIVAMPSIANAATGGFSYKFVDSQGIRQTTTMTDPPSRECINLSEVENPYASTPADSPRNDTDETATVFGEPDCEGDHFTLWPHGGHAGDRLKLRSVVFS